MNMQDDRGAAKNKLREVVERFGIGMSEFGSDAITSLEFPNALDRSLVVQLHFLRDAGPARVQSWLASRPDTPHHYTILAASWLSEQSLQLCADAGTGALDLAGNYRLDFHGYHLERLGFPPPKTVTREVGAYFQGKSLRVIRLLLAQPDRPWSAQQLAEKCLISRGLATSVRNRLIEHDWLTESKRGLRVSNPASLLQTWAEWPEKTATTSLAAHTILHGSRLAEALKSMPDEGRHALLAASSAAEWMAPVLQDRRVYLLADHQGYQHLQRGLELEEVARGANVNIELDVEGGKFLDRFQPAPGIWTTSPTQTYVELYRQGNRSRQAAAKLLQDYLQPIWQGDRPYVSWPLRDNG